MNDMKNLKLALAGTLAAAADCACRNRGVEVPEGKTACIQTGKGPQLALCEKNLNVTNWRFLGQGCPTAGREHGATGCTSDYVNR